MYRSKVIAHILGMKTVGLTSKSSCEIKLDSMVKEYPSLVFSIIKLMLD